MGTGMNCTECGEPATLVYEAGRCWGCRPRPRGGHMRWTMPKLYMLVALRYAEQHPDRGNAYAAKVDSRQTAIARSLAAEGLVKLGRAKPPDHGATAALTDDGRGMVDTILGSLPAMFGNTITQAASGAPRG